MGDYDGDVLSLRGLYSDEANEEVERIMHSKASALTVSGSNIKAVSKELLNSFYELTRIGNNGKQISKLENDKLLQLKVEDITLEFLTNSFADKYDSSTKKIKKSHFNTWDLLEVPANYFYLTHPKKTMTIGRFIFNKFILQGANIIISTGIKDEVMKKSSIGDLDTLIGKLYLENKINREQYNAYTNRRDTLGYWINGFLAHTISEKMLKPLPQIEKRKAELVKKYEKELAEGNIDVMDKIQKELIAYSKELLKDDPGMNLYDSGDLDFNNNYRNNMIIKGAVKNEITGEFDFIDTSFADGLKIKDIPAHANSILASQYPASIALAQSGYMGKKILALLQMTQIDNDGTDCGTKKLIPIKVTKQSGTNLVYSIFKDRTGKERVFENKDIQDYMGEVIFIRTPMTCLNEKICSKCAGRLFYLLGINNAGLFTTQLSHANLNLALKAKHDNSINLHVINPSNIIIDI